MKKRFWVIASSIFLLGTLTACVPMSSPSVPTGETAQEQALTDQVSLYVNSALNFSVEIPSILEGKFLTKTTERQAYGETITTVTVSYPYGDGNSVNVLSFEEMSSSVWEQMQAEGGPLGTLLGESPAGRVIILNTLQSNPFSEGTPEYDLFQEYPKFLSIVTDSFQFLDTETDTETETNNTRYSNTELGFSVQLPAILEGNYQTTTTERQAYGEIITTVTVSYPYGDGDSVNVLSFEEMSSSAWEQMQAEGGPLGILLGESLDGRVVILNTLQSNPFPEGTPEYDLFQELPGQLSIIQDTFQF